MPTREADRSAARRQVQRRRNLAAALFLLPTLFCFGFFAWWPICRAVVMAFQQTNLADPPTWVGLDNFRSVLDDPLLWTAVRNTVWFTLLCLVIGYPVPLLVAVLIGEVRRFRGLYTVLVYLPVIIPPVVSVLMWKFFFDAGRRGVFNTILGWVGLGPYPWIQDTAWAMPSLVAEATWAGFGGTAIIYLAAVRGIPPDLYDAADIDGASVLAKLRHITIPQLLPLLLTMLILQVIGTMQVFLEPYVFTGGGPDNATTTILMLVYRYAFYNSLGQQFGAATALSVMLALCLGVLSAVYFWLTNRWGGAQ